MKSSKKKRWYPPYPDSNWDYAIIEMARQALRKPNRNICIYCHEQSVGTNIKHTEDCPVAKANGGETT